jgi:succinoglycan biosynthesis transport protein ExoP
MTNAIDIYRAGDQGIATVAEDAGYGNPNDRLNLHTLVTAFRRRFHLFCSVVSVVVLLALAFTLHQTPLFTATAQVVLDSQEAQVAPVPSSTASVAIYSPDHADTEVQIIRSREMAEHVARALNLVADPAFRPGAAPSGPIATLRHLLGRGPQAPARPTQDQVMRAVVDRLTEGLNASRSDETRALTISFTATDPNQAARIANEFANQYTNGQLEDKQAESQKVIRVLAPRLEQLRVQAQADTQRVQQYRIAHNLLTTSGASLTEQEISSYNQAALDTARNQLRNGSHGDDVGAALESPVVGGLRARQAEVSGRLAVLNARYGPLHPDVIKARSELADVNGQIESEIHRVISNLEAKARVSAQRLSSLDGSLSSARGTLAENNRSEVGLDDLERRAAASQALYDSYLSRYKQVVAQSGTESSDAHIISRAEPPASPSSPKLILNLLLALVIGSGLGVAVAFVVESMFAGLTTGSDVEARLRLRYLGSVPTLKTVLPEAPSAVGAIVEQPLSAFTEVFRGIRTAVDYIAMGRARVVAIASALPKEGKTTIAVCLTRTIGLSGASVVLLDCDSRRRGVTRMFRGTEGMPGLADVLRGDASIDDVLIRDQLTGAYFLLIGENAGDLPELITSEAMPALLAKLRERFNYVIIDTAPILPIAETRVLARWTDLTLIVARWRDTPDHAVRAALRLLPIDAGQIGGVILSRVDMRRQAKYGRGDPTYYYKRYTQYYA